MILHISVQVGWAGLAWVGLVSCQPQRFASAKKKQKKNIATGCKLEFKLLPLNIVRKTSKNN